MRVAANGKDPRGPSVHHPGPLEDGAWSGRRCFVVGGGESLKGFDWSRLEGELTIAVNATAKRMSLPPTIAFTMDAAYARKQIDPHGQTLPWEDGVGLARPQNPEWAALPSVKVFHDATPDGWPWEGWLERGFSAHIGSSGWLRWGTSLEDGLVWSCNSGLGAINLADVLGASPIYLLGFDGHGAHFHDDYRGGPTVEYHAMAAGWHKACLDQVRGDVLNLNPESSLPWPKDALGGKPWLEELPW